MPPGGNLGQHNKSQGQLAIHMFVLLKYEHYSQSTNISPLSVCVELTLEFILW